MDEEVPPEVDAVALEEAVVVSEAVIVVVVVVVEVCADTQQSLSFRKGLVLISVCVGGAPRGRGGPRGGRGAPRGWQ